MRVTLADSIIQFSKTNEIIFLTGDLGFMALEELRDSLGDRFINCGVSEQNMIGVAAGLAKQGFRVFVYSIALVLNLLLSQKLSTLELKLEIRQVENL